MDLFAHDDYKEYLRSRFDASLTRAGFSGEIGCQSSFLSQVLNGKPHLSLEQGIRANRVLRHNHDEAEFFMDLLQKGRAGSRELEDFFEARLKARRQAARPIARKIPQSEELTGAARTQYYSRFLYAAVHVLTAVPTTGQPRAIARMLDIDETEVRGALDFLVAQGLVEAKGGAFRPSKKRVHTKSDNLETSLHHRNFRLEAMRRIESRSPRDLFYSGIFALSKTDLEKMRAAVLALIEENEKILAGSHDEVAYVLNMDFFHLAR